MKVHIQTIHEILDSLEKEFSIDTSREYVTGLSMGGECTWMSIIERPERFAAAVPICAGDKFIGMEPAEMGRKFAQFPLWIFHGDADDVISVDVSRKLVKALRDAAGHPKYTEYPGVDHGSWELAYRDPELIEWLFAQTRQQESPASENKPAGKPATEGAILWKRVVGENIESSTAVDENGNVYATGGGNLWCFSSDGELRWKTCPLDEGCKDLEQEYPYPLSNSSSPAVSPDGQSVYVTGYAGAFAFRTRDGKVLWKKTVFDNYYEFSEQEYEGQARMWKKSVSEG
jgi:hypothetical protein